MHVCKTVHGGDFNEITFFNFTKLFYACLQILKRDLHGNENLRERKMFFGSFVMETLT